MDKMNKEIFISRYNIPFDIEGHYFILHGLTGAMDEVDKNIYKFLSGNGDNFDRERALEMMEESDIPYLLERGYITKRKDEEEAAVADMLSEVICKKRNTSSVTIIPSYTCNFRCRYCFEASQGVVHKKQDVMTCDMVDSIFSFIDEKNAMDKVIGTITLYGGEPLLEENYDIVVYILKKAKERDLAVHAVTNGFSLEYYRNVLKEGLVQKLQITLDGMEQTHNRRRPHYKGENSFKKIINNIELIKDYPVKISIRINVDKENIAEAPELIDFFAQKGWRESTGITYYFKATHACYETDASRVIYDHELFMKLTDDVKGGFSIKNMGLYGPIIKKLEPIFEDGRIPGFTAKYCGACGKQYVIDPLGDVYPCWEVVQDLECIVGKLGKNGKMSYGEKFAYWADRTVKNMEECRKCAFAFICAGGCAAHARVEMGTIYSKARCELKQPILDTLKYLAKRKGWET